MFATTAPEPIASVISVTETRARVPGVQRSLSPQGAAAAPVSAKVGDRLPNSGQPTPKRVAPPEPKGVPASMFAAAIIAGALPPSPQSMGEVLRRIGSSPIPAESETKLMDLFA